MRRFPATRGFTLLELMTAMAIAMALAGLCVGAFVQIRSAVRRAEARMALYDSAQGIYAKLNQSMSSLMQHCAFVAQSDAGGVTLVFMRGKEDAFDWLMMTRQLMNTDMVWEEWRWSATTGVLSQGSSSPQRKWVSGSPSQTYLNVPRPLRYLDPANPTGLSPTARTGLNANQYFWGAASGDFSDAEDLANRLAPVLSNVSDFQIQFVTQAGTVKTVATSTPVTCVQQGVWMDGRIGAVDANTKEPGIPAAADYAASEIANRPVLLRVRFTIDDPTVDRKAPLQQTFTFSFALPGLSGQP